MKKTMKFAAMAFAAAALLVACNDKGKEGPNGGGPVERPFELDEPLVSGAIKAGFPAQIVITGEGFLPDEDYIYVGYKNGEETVYDRISAEYLEITSKRVSFGVHIAASYIDKTVKVWLDRAGYDERFEISGDITFTLPAVAEGYIPDPAFRATLASASGDEGNPKIAPLFNAYGIIDPVAAAKVTEGKDGYGLNLYGSKATSLEGIELFSGVTGLVVGWGGSMSEIKEIDLSKWTAKKLDLRFTNCPKLEKFIGAPYAYRTDIYECPNLTYADLSPSKWCYNIQLYNDGSPTKFSAVTYLDIRRQRTGERHTGDENADYPDDTENDYAVILPGAYMKVADNCKILVDYQFLLDKRGGTVDDDTPAASGYATIYRAWKRGATIDVYDSQNITRKIGTVPMFSADADALTLPGSDNGWTPQE